MDWQLLAKSQPAFALIPDRLRSRAERWELEAGETLFRIGDKVAAVFSVIQGEVHLVRRGPKGTEVVLKRARNGFFQKRA